MCIRDRFMRPRNEAQSDNNDIKLKLVVYVMEHASRLADASCACV